MNQYIRLGIGLGAVGGVTGGAYLINKQLSSDTIAKKLEANGYKLPNDKEDNNWVEILNHYKIKKELQFEGFDGITAPNNGEALKKKCESIIKESLASEENYKKAEKWCVVPEKLTEALKRKGYRALSWDNTKDEDQKDWDTKLEEYEKDDKEKAEKKFSDLNTLKEGQNALEKNPKTRNKLKEKCKGLEEKKHYESDFDSNLEKAKLWCAVETTSKEQN